MNDFPDILGMELHDATALLEAGGLEFIIVETKAANRKKHIPDESGQFAPQISAGVQKELPEGVLRVIKVKPKTSDSAQSEQNQPLVLTVCRI